MRWYERPRAAAAADDDDGDGEAGVVDGSQRFEFVLERYWSNMTYVLLQCSLTVSTNMQISLVSIEHRITIS